jgi:alpha-ribazole phosphatase
VNRSSLLVVRHARVAVEGVCYGQSDVPTLLDGREAAARIVRHIDAERWRVEHVWASPWARTREPATVLAGLLGVPLTIDPRLSELHFGAWEGRRYADLEADARFADWMQNWQDAAPPQGERLDELLGRVRSWRDEARVRNEAALAVTHAGVVRALRALGRCVPYASIAREAVEPLVVERMD